MITGDAEGCIEGTILGKDVFRPRSRPIPTNAAGSDGAADGISVTLRPVPTPIIVGTGMAEGVAEGAADGNDVFQFPMRGYPRPITSTMGSSTHVPSASHS